MNASARTGVLLVNLGTPDAPTPRALRRYLAEFLSDSRVIGLPRALWWPILHGLILRVRPRRSAALYRAIWMPTGSPLLIYTQRLTAALARRLSDLPEAPIVAFAMRYGRPSISEVIDRLLREQAIERLIVLPLYPQYAQSSSASALDGVAQRLQHVVRIPHLVAITHYHEHPAYLTALTHHLHRLRAEAPDRYLLFSFHGLPLRSHGEGDPYYTQCLSTAQHLATRLGLESGRWSIAFQSRFGPAAWLPPYTIEEVRRLAHAGIRELDVTCPGFACDCLETLEEIAHTNAEAFHRAGGRVFRYLPALNDDPLHVDFLRTLLEPFLEAPFPGRRHLGILDSPSPFAQKHRGPVAQPVRAGDS